jgi:hypothetical protein
MSAVHDIGKVKLPLCLTEHHAVKAYGRGRGIAPRILILSTRWMGVVGFAPRLLYPLYPLNKKSGWALEPVWTRLRREKYLATTGDRTRSSSP